MKIPIKPLLFLILILVATVSAALSLNLLDLVVQGTLYSFGLQFSYEWAYPYWILLRTTQFLLGLISTVALLGTVYSYKSTSKKTFKPLLFTVAILTTTISAAYTLTRLDQIVHGQLYFFGLRFSYEWANPYWTILRAIQASLGFIVIVTIANTILPYTHYARKKQVQALKIKPTIKIPKTPRLISIPLLSVGALALTFSVIYTSSILAFIGLGLTLWGALLLYITPIHYVKKDLLNSSLISSLSAIDTLITSLDYQGKGIYMPPATLKEIKGGAVFIPAAKSTSLPSAEEMTEGKVILHNPNGIRLVPPGLELANLLEAEMKTDFTKVDLEYLQNNLSKALIEDLETVEDFEMQTDGNSVHTKMTRTIYNDLYKKEGLQNVCLRIGCPLCSAIALILTRTTGKPVIIEKVQFNKNQDTVEADYNIKEA